MPHVSPRKVKRKTLGKIHEILLMLVTSRNLSQKQQRLAVSELLTETEKTMLGKRIAAVSLLSQGMSGYQVGKTLQLSPTTVGQLEGKLEMKKYQNLDRAIKVLKKGPLHNYLENLLKPLPQYGTSPATLFKEK